MCNVNVRLGMLGLALRLCLFAAIAVAPGLAHSQPPAPMPQGPVAYIGHGAMFDRNGNKLVPTPEFIEHAQGFYIGQLLERADEGQRQRFRELEAQLVRGLTLEGQSHLVLNSRLIEWLIRTVRPEGADRLLGINNVMKLELQRRLPETPGQGGPRERFQMPDELRRRLQDAGLAESGVSGSIFALATTAGGEAYRELCRSNGVPVPPDWDPRFMMRSNRDPRLAINAWDGARHGTVLRLHEGCRPDNPDCTWHWEKGMIVSDRDPRLAINAWDGARHGTVLRLHEGCRPDNPDCTWHWENGMIVSNRDPRLAINAWDGARHGTVLRLHEGCRPDNPDCTWRDFGAWIGRGTLTVDFVGSTPVAEVFTFSSPEGICIALPRSDGDTIKALGVICLGKASGKACFWDNYVRGVKFFPRRGEVVPFSRFGGGADLVGDDICTDCHAGENPYVIHPNTPLGSPTLAGLPLFADRWYEPLVVDFPDWPQNPGPLDSPGACAACHTGGIGGRFPELSNQLPGYCNTVLSQAIMRTMPPGAPGSLAGDPHPVSLLAMCRNPPPSGSFALDGRITLLRVHDVGTKFGPPADQLDAEVIVNLDSSDKAFGFQLRRDTNAAAHMGMLDDLREAFDRDRRVRLEWVRVGPRTGRITRVIRLN